MRNLLFLLLILAIPTEDALAQVDRCAVLPTLDDYMTRDYGDPARMVWPPIPSDGAVCEKLRRDRAAYMCQSLRAENKESSLERSLRSVRPSLRSARNARPAQVGGAAAKARSVAGLSRLLLEREAEIREAQASQVLAAGFIEEAEKDLAFLECRFTKRN